MKAVIYERYGGPEVLKLTEIPMVEPGKNEIKIKVIASSATTADWRVRSLSLPKGFKLLGRLFLGISGPRQKILGTELSGVIVKIGPNVTKFKVGDEVIAECGAKMRSYVEYRVLSEDDVIVKKPEFLTFEEAATISFGASTAWIYLTEKTKITPGMAVLVNGASGSVGSAAVQIAKYFGAHVTAVCSESNFALVKSLGADAVIDYTHSDFTQNGKRYNIIFDSVGNLSFTGVKDSLTEDGELLLVSGDLPQLLQSAWINLTTHRKVIAGPVAGKLKNLESIMNLVEQKKYVPVVDRIFPLEQISAAHEYIEKRHRKGNVAIRVQ